MTFLDLDRDTSVISYQSCFDLAVCELRSDEDVESVELALL